MEDAAKYYSSSCYYHLATIAISSANAVKSNDGETGNN